MKKKINQKKALFSVITAVIIVGIVVIGPMDKFCHGYYYDVDEYEKSLNEKEIETIDLSKKNYEIVFVPVEDHFAGFVINMIKSENCNEGNLLLLVYHEDGTKIDNVVIDVNNIKSQEWHHAYTKSFLKKGERYTLKVSTKGCSEPLFLLIADDKIPENGAVESNAMIEYAYKQSTFSFREKVLITFYLIGTWFLICWYLFKNNRFAKYVLRISIFLFLVTMLSWNYMNNSMDNRNDMFENFAPTGEALVMGPILAEENGIEFSDDDKSFGLGFYKDIQGEGSFSQYESQYGLQGKVFKEISQVMKNYIGYESIVANLHFLCCMLTAITFVVIIFLLYEKYNMRMATCFYITFWLSPWIVNFAKELYWVEFTWFTPMAIGIFCSWKINNRTCRIVSYTAAFFSILIKSLCGYEYVSTAMVPLIAFLIADFMVASARKEREMQRLLFKTIIILGLMALMGFIVALCMHAYIIGNGDIIGGIKFIWNDDVLRRTNGANLNNFDTSYWNSFNASIWEVLGQYFDFSTEIIAGVPGNMFPILCCAPLGIFVYDFVKGRLNIELASLYLTCFIASVSWICLAKSHSYIHTMINYVVWYFGFVQMCIYVIVNRIIVFVGKDYS